MKTKNFKKNISA